MKMQINATKVKQYREQKCWSQLQLSEMAGISLRTLQRVEAQSVASQETIKSLAAVMEMDCEALLPEPENDVTVQNEASNVDSKRRHKKELIVSIVVVIVVFGFAFFSIFNAYAEQRLDESSFQLFKNLTSGAFLLSVAGVLYQAYRKGLINKSDFL